MKLAWITDPHLNFVPEQAKRFQFYDRIRATAAEKVLISGDIGESSSALVLTAELGKRTNLPVLFVYGNHDYYGADIDYVREETPRDERLVYLPMAGVVPLTELTCVVGQDGWGDGYAGHFMGSRVILADWVHIADFRVINAVGDVEARLKKLRSLAAADAKMLEADLMTAVTKFRNIIVVTHVPPFEDATWHHGEKSEPHWLPWFTCQAIGNVLGRIACSFPTNQFTVLCGHTHGRGIFRPPLLPNLTVKTGAARYQYPSIEETLEVP